ncbi:hypothetical protein Mal4_46680 [Maioricimonas rarisocia]|uniref:Lipoprotein n=1 Tax=Maioricimonas rarisocia TaxID=2528026 RepID=A0A517ZCY1_9PLAN|nr:DUF6655 family protein [Maioricimonas rarisocia]QDU40312.1 hypothetical protein Mal4_46680 [Maioricimonas rarisocia]
MSSLRLCLTVLCLGVACGCTSTKTSNTARTAVEQLLISNAVDQALDRIDFRPFAGQPVFIQEKYVDCVDKAYVVASLRHRVMNAGGKIVDAVDDATVVLELRSGSVGTNTSESFIGVPEVALPGMMTLPEVQLLTRTYQTGTAKLGLVAYDARTKTVLGAGGVSLAQSDDSNWFVAGVGPFQTGSVRSEVKKKNGKGTSQFTPSRLPDSVAFQTPAPAEDAAGEVQFTSGEQPAK